MYKINGNYGLTAHTYVFGIAESESVVRLTPSPEGQGHVKGKCTKLMSTNFQQYMHMFLGSPNLNPWIV